MGSDVAQLGDTRLAARGLTVEVLRAAVASKLALLPDDLLLACGSVVEGLGNAKSDVDLMLITRRDDPRRDLEREQLLAIGANWVDVRVHSRQSVDRLLDRLAAWAVQTDNPRLAKAFGYDDQKILHRLFHGLALAGTSEWRTLTERMPANALARHMVDWSLYFAETHQLDLAGFASENDAPSMRHAARLLLGHCLDICLALHGLTHPNTKWRARMLQQLQPDWERVLPGRDSGLSALLLWLRLESFEERSVVAQCHHICTFARRVLPIARVTPVPRWRWNAPTRQSSVVAESAWTARRLPLLDLDIAVRSKDDAFEVFRLSSGREIFRLNTEQYAALTYFDGLTTYAEAAAWTSEQAVDQVEAVVNQGRFWAGTALDSHAFRELLSGG